MAVTKRIFQLAKEFERDEKEIMAFLTTQGIKVSNRLSAVSEETYNMLKTKFLAPPEPEPEPEPPKPEPKPAPAAQTEENQPAPAAKKKKKKNKAPQPAPAEEAQPKEQAEAKPEAVAEEEQPVKEVSDEKISNMERRTRSILFEGIKAGNEFIRRYTSHAGQGQEIDKGKKSPAVPRLKQNMDTWAILFNHRFEYSDDSPVRYWHSVAKLMTRAFKIMNSFGMSHREALAEMRDAVFPLGTKYQPREIFTPEENQKFEEQQLLLFRSFGHGMGIVNDNLYDLKLKAERMKVEHERMSFLEYVTNPQNEYRSSERVPFNELVEAVTYSVRGVARRFDFYQQNKERINKIVKNFAEWLDGYAKLKEQGAPAEKLEKYLALEQKFVDLAEFMSFDNLLDGRKNKPKPFDIVIDLLNEYRDNMDDPDAERNFKYKVRGVTNITFKPKEYVFLYRFAELEPQKDYRPPEEIAAAEAAAKAAAEAAANEVSAEQEETSAEENNQE